MGMRSPRQWFYDLLSKGEPRHVNENAVVDAGLVSVTEGPMVLARIHEAGIGAEGIETREHPYSAMTMTRIVCRAGDVQRVRQIIDDVTS
jgi:hypothetical protein